MYTLEAETHLSLTPGHKVANVMSPNDTGTLAPKIAAILSQLSQQKQDAMVKLLTCLTNLTITNREYSYLTG